MKATIEFNLDEQDDYYNHKRAVKALDILLVVMEMDEHLRTQIKYADDKMSDAEYALLEKLRDRLHEIMDEHAVSIDDLTY